MNEQFNTNSYEHQRLSHPRKVPWVMKQTWLDNLFIHYPVKLEELSKLVPQSLTLDTFNNTGWISIVPYLTTSVRARGLPPIPGLSQFLGFNVRTYIQINGKPGVYFFNLAAANWLTAKMAKQSFRLPYVYLNMDYKKVGDTIHFESAPYRRNEENLWWKYRPISEPRLAKKGTLEEWLVERYCLYTVNDKGEPFRSDILHRSWLLQDADVDFQHNSILKQFNLLSSVGKPIFHYSKKAVVRIWPILPCSKNE
ncbi:YqjF family protein [Ureibacillus acetophenoni]|uniref:DUF2071 domain-containing protein n=1 Tax=Ureibacillus acetophenoni TaxID=614649 RepID=A0A285UCS2_9BACL|nr:DUF2071 domain-containing protein [Ureibacillus acetophenoni]SOC39715.1 hypothetical protein SAMN05877842_10680 [Ureibacillus acetophenoni]